MSRESRLTTHVALVIGLGMGTLSCAHTSSNDVTATAATPPIVTGDHSLSAEALDYVLQRELAMIFPAVIRADGGFDAPVGAKADDPLFSVLQARLTWLASAVVRHRPALKEQYEPYIQHGLKALRQLWDSQHGGIIWELSRTGEPTVLGNEKHLYAQVFALYAAAWAYQATSDDVARQLAVNIFNWLETHAVDHEFGGYHESYQADGIPILRQQDSLRQARSDLIGTPYGHKSMNAHIHALEALTAWYQVSPSPRVRQRLQEVHQIVLQRLIQPHGSQALVMTRDWKPMKGHRSFGHDVETAFLLVESAQALGIPEDQQTWKAARLLVDTALAHGWDTVEGGFQEDPAAGRKQKPWWGQAEGFNALLLMDERFGKETQNYQHHAIKLWHFIQNHMLDEQGRWHTAASPENSWTTRRWYAGYHTGRAMMLSADRLSARSGREGAIHNK